jgi:hypothetical protein
MSALNSGPFAALDFIILGQVYIGFSLGKKMGKFAQAFCFCLSVLGCWAVIFHSFGKRWQGWRWR